jgi:hypothetical protein
MDNLLIYQTLPSGLRRILTLQWSPSKAGLYETVAVTWPGRDKAPRYVRLRP